MFASNVEVNQCVTLTESIDIYREERRGSIVVHFLHIEMTTVQVHNALSKDVSVENYVDRSKCIANSIWMLLHAEVEFEKKMNFHLRYDLIFF